MSNRFDFEELIFKCWHVTDDIDTVVKFTDGIDLNAIDKDKLQNMLIGMSALYNHRFNELMDMFGELVRNRTILGPSDIRINPLDV